jgi:ABC-type antimicrobial peptide transport system permease subunit
VGIVKDFKTNSLREDVKPTLIAQNNQYYAITGIKMKSSNIPTVDVVRKLWDKAIPEYAYRSSFLDESIDEFYKQEEQLSLLYKIFAGIAILISCLGLYGLVSFLTAQKTKEIGIRKVLGATVAQIVYMFSKEFMVLILVAFMIAIPVAICLMRNWLDNFVFKIDLGVGFFVATILLTTVVAWMTVGYKAAKAAKANPVKSLKTE